MLLNLAIVAQIPHAIGIRDALTLLIDSLNMEGGALDVLAFAVKQFHVERVETLVEP